MVTIMMHASFFVGKTYFFTTFGGKKRKRSETKAYLFASNFKFYTKFTVKSVKSKKWKVTGNRKKEGKRELNVLNII